VKCCCFCKNHCERIIQFQTSLEKKKERVLATWQLVTFRFGTFTISFYAIRNLVSHETLKDEWYVVIKAYKFTTFEFSFYQNYIV